MATQRPSRAQSTASMAAADAPPPLSAGRIGFLGDYWHSRDSGEATGDRVVLTLCWPTSARAWEPLVNAWSALRALREPATGIETSVLCRVAPQLTAQLHEPSAQESTLAALIARANFRCCAAVYTVKPTDHALKGRARAVADAPLAECMASYDDFLKTPGHRPFEAMVTRSRGDASDRAFHHAFQGLSRQLTGARWLDAMRLLVWDGAVEPLPLEVANLASWALARRSRDPSAINLIADAIIAKLVRFPNGVAPPRRIKRR